MKKIMGILGLILALGMGFFGCAQDDSSGGLNLPEASAEVPEGYLRVNYKGYGTYYLWAWKDLDAETTKDCVSWNEGGIKFDHKNGNFVCVDLKLNNPASIVGLIVKDYSGDNKYTGDADIMFYFPKKYNQIYFNNDKSGKIYVDSDCTQEPVGTSGASITGNKKITLNCNGVTLSAETVKLTDKDGSAIGISTYGEKELTLQDNIKTNYSSISPLKIEVTDNEGGTDTLTVSIASTLVESWFATPAKTSLEGLGVLQLGMTLNENIASFKSWAPIASSCELLLFESANKLDDEPARQVEMAIDENGFWTVENVDVSSYKYYKYRITNNDIVKDVADIWGMCASGNSTASQIVTLDDVSTKPDAWEADYTNPFGNSGAETKSYSDAVIYEMHIRDWSRAFNKDSKGRYQDITNALKNNGEFAKHLKDLGITHVQILPMFDHAETNESETYNWGYNPYHYNVPEGRYVNYGANKDGSDAVIQMREMIKAFHDAGIAVIMDVVYNHTSGTGSGSLYDMTIPEYFYRFDSQGSYSNGSGCGNEVATNNVLVKKYVIDSLKHWMKDYHINGFRFDLMGVHEQSTMKDIYNELYTIDKNVMVYGEPWTGGTSAVKKGCTGAIDSTTGEGVGAFDDDFRNAIKGGEFGGFGEGQVQGKYKDDNILKGLTGSSSTRNETGKKELSLHYIECHDNYTLFDKLAISYLGKTSFSGDLYKEIGDKGLKEVKAQNKLAAAYIFLSQGTPFINGGQEFMRTKQGNENSYASSDEINQIDLTFKETYSDVYKVYKGLIKLRKENPAFTKSNDANAEILKDDSNNEIKGVTKYTTGDFLVYFNATDSDVDITTTGYTKAVDVTSGTPTESELPAKVGAKSFVILKK